MITKAKNLGKYCDALTKLPFPMHSPMKNQQATSTPTTTFMAVWKENGLSWGFYLITILIPGALSIPGKSDAED